MNSALPRLGAGAAIVGLVGLLSPGLAAAKKKPKEAPAPPVGWHQEEGWKGACYFPPDFGKMLEGDRRAARAAALDDMLSQWNGKRDDGVEMSETLTEALETVLLGAPTKIEAVTLQNLAQCKAYMAGGGLDAWTSWVRAAPGKLTAGECMAHFDYTLFDYLEIGQGWQRPVNLCKGDKINISGTEKDKFRISDDGPWINVAGDTNTPTFGGDWPCNVEGCFAGMLVARFVTEAGVETILPVGEGIVFEAPEHGELTYRINDTTFFDNTWFKSGSITDRTAIELSPAQ